MRLSRDWALVVVTTLALTGACSLHSLDYLSADGDELNVGGDSVSGGMTSEAGAIATGGISGSSSGGVMAASGTGNTQAGSGASGGSETMSEAGAAGASGIPELPDCGDSQQTVDETDIDCGGRTCEPCPTDDRCITGTDCQSAICTNQICQAPTCADLALNGDETDLNCGGKCAACALGQHCKLDADCSTKKCTEGLCESSVCQDGVLQDGCPLLVDSTPYVFFPEHALQRCVDDNAQSTVEGNGMILWWCKKELHQTFWAIAQAGGYFAFRNALSGKCLQVRGASVAENAVVEQSSCDFAPEQLWKPSRVDSTYMQLTNKLSSLALDVAGSNVDADGQVITQSKVSGSADTHWRLQKSNGVAFVALSASDDTARRLHHDGSTVTLSADDTPSEQWKIVSGLYDAQFVSFQSRDEPGRYLRHSAYKLWCDTNDGSSQFKQDATFRFDNPLVGYSPMSKSLESNNFPGRFLQRSGDVVLLTQKADDAAYKSAATWIMTAR
jgi:hypothetical protein